MDLTTVELRADQIGSPDSHPAKLQTAIAEALGVDESVVAASVFRAADYSLQKIRIEVVGLFDKKIIETAAKALVVEPEENEIAEAADRVETDSAYTNDSLIEKIKLLERRVEALEKGRG